MKNWIQDFKIYCQQPGVMTSLLVSIFSAIILTISLLAREFSEEALEKISFLSLMTEIIYGIIMIVVILRNRAKYSHIVPFLYLNWFIGCFCTNTFINIFENLPVWVYLITFTFCFSCFFIYSKPHNKILTITSYLINGISFPLILYFMFFLIPILGYSIIGMLALGLGFYGLVPFIVTVIHISKLVLNGNTSKSYWTFFASGFISVILGLILLIIGLNHETKEMSKNLVTKSFQTNEDLPAYIKVSQNTKPNFLNEIILKKDLVYVSTDNFFEFRGLNSFGNQQYNERKEHNPIINLAYTFTNPIELSDDDKINILKSNFDKRLETEEQLWSGKELITKNIKEDVKIFPKERLAYTEITMDIACEKGTWGQKEAIYSFQLPEGSVATSLSLWVNGIERKGVLTTKEKAKAAYNQIVGVEARDPSLMQWKEGNRIVVRVFPITMEMPRTFKCGFTTPLKLENDKIKYESLSIKGPNISNAETISRLQIVGKEKFEASKDFELENSFYINESKGLDDWNASLAISTSTNSSSFVWKNKSYSVKPIEKNKIAFSPSEIILDLNNGWILEEIKSILEIKNKKYFVINDEEKTEITTSNYETIFEEFKKLNYTLPKFYKLNSNSLVITKCGSFSPNFEELENSKYLEKIKSRTKDKNIKVINISENTNPFWQTIKEQNYVEYLKTDLKTSLDLISKNQFISCVKSENRVNIEQSGISIYENATLNESETNGSNHIYRMYAFGKVMSEQVEIQNDSLKSNQFVNLAKDANIVTPITSLIVLETDEDYKNNDIEKNVNTLGNANINNDGAVPEPYEWVLIIIGLSALFVYSKKNKLQTN